LYKFGLRQIPDDLKPIIALITCTLAFCFAANSQTFNADHYVIANAGDYYDDGTNQLSFTLGETVIQTVGTKATFLTQGFQQSAFIITTVEELTPFNYQVKAFPNPTGGVLYVETNQSFPMNLSVIDINGKQIMQSESRNKVSQLDFSNLPNAAYLLRVTDESGTQIKTFQIQKVQ